MFKSYTYKKYLGYNETTKLYSYEYEIVDTDFTETATGRARGAAASVATGPAEVVVNTYSKRNLNVPLNLILCMQYVEKKYATWTIDQQIEHNRKYVPNFSQYEQDIRKYLTLI